MNGDELRQLAQAITWPAAFLGAVIVIAVALIIIAWIRALLKG